MKSIKYLLWLTFMLPATASAWQWMDLWQTPEQQGSKLLRAGKPQAAAQVFKDKNWQGVSHYRAGNYVQAYKQFNENNSSDGQYNAGNAAAFMGKYQEAIAAYDKAIAFNPDNKDAITNLDIIKKLLQQQQQDKSSANSRKNDKNNSASQQDNFSQNSGQKNQSDQQKQQHQDQQKNSPAKSDQQQLTNNSKQSQPDKTQQKPANQQQNVNAAAADSKQQRQDENNKQLLRRLSDDPGGLLQNKFLRDYARRHGVDVDSNQGGNS